MIDLCFGSFSLRVLFLAPHPDDIETFACGSAIKHSEMGDESIEIIMSYGEKSAVDESLLGEKLAKIREKEGRRGAKILGMSELQFLDFEDIGISGTEDKSAWWTWTTPGIDWKNYKILKDKIFEINPDLVYSPSHKRSPYRHKDHLATGMMTITACKEMDNPPLVRLYHGLCPDRIIDVSDYLDRIKKARDVHQSQEFMIRPLSQVLNAFSRFRGLRMGCKYGEGFIEIQF